MTTPEQVQYLSTCPACEGVLDVTAFEPYSKVLCPTCGQSVRVRRKFDHFVINRQLGEGGMSRVFESSDQVLNRRVALKILNRHYSRDGARMAQFEREAQLPAAVNHPNVVKVYTTGRDQGNFYIAMELVGGGSLDQRITERGHLSEREALRVGRAVAEGLRAAYRDGLIHRDVKPANILFTEDDIPKIVDFGLALFHERDVDDSGEIWATPFYVAPEKVKDDREDFRSDMFSLGATLFHALTGRPPHQANTNSISELKRIKSRPVRLADSGMRFSQRTCALVDRLLALAPEGRFQSYDELVEAFRDAEGFLGYSERGLRTRRQKIIFAAIGATAAVVAFLALVPRSGDGKPKSVTVVTRTGAGELSELGRTLASGAKSAAEVFRSARETLVDGKVREAHKMFDELVKSEVTKPYTRNLARFNAALCAIVDGQRDAAVRYFKEIRRDADADADVGGEELKRFFSRFGGRMAQGLGLDLVRGAMPKPYGTANEEALAYLVHGLAQWHFGDPQSAADWIDAFDACEPGKGFEWIATYKKLSAPYAADIKALRALGRRGREPFPDIAAARADLKGAEAALASLKTGGTVRTELAARIQFAQEEIGRLKREEQKRLAEAQQQTRRRELAQLSDLLASLPSLARGYDNSRIIELLKDTRFETPEVQSALANKRYLWTKAQEFLDQLMADVNGRGYAGTVARRTGSILQGRVLRMDLSNATLAMTHGELAVPTDSLAPEALVAMAQVFAAQVRDSTEYYRRQELIAVFAKMQGLEGMAHAVAEHLMEENRAFRQRWTLVEQSGS